MSKSKSENRIKANGLYDFHCGYSLEKNNYTKEEEYNEYKVMYQKTKH